MNKSNVNNDLYVISTTMVLSADRELFIALILQLTGLITQQ